MDEQKSNLKRNGSFKHMGYSTISEATHAQKPYIIGANERWLDKEACERFVINIMTFQLNLLLQERNLCDNNKE